MPAFPTYTSKQNIQISGKGIDTAVKAPPYTGAGTNVLKPLVEAAQTIEEHWSNAQDTMQYTSAQNQMELLTLQREQEAEKDPNMNNADFHKLELQKSRASILSGVDNKLIQQKLALEVDHNFQISSMKIDNVFRKKQMLDNEVKLDQFVNTMIEKKSTTDNKMLFNKIDSKIKETIYDNVARGLISEAKGKAYLDSVRTGTLDYAIANNPNKALAELQKNKEGLYKDLSLDERTAYIKEAETKIDKIQKQEETYIAIAMNKRESELIDMDIAGKLDKPTILNERKAGLISAKFAESEIRKLESPKTVNAKTDLATYDEVMSDILNKDLTATELRSKILDKHAAGKLTLTDVKHFLYVEKGDGITTIQEDYESEKDALNQPKKQPSTFWKTARDIAMKAGGPLFNIVMNGIINRASTEGAKGEQIVNIANDEARKQRLKDRPDFAGYSAKGQLGHDRFGNHIKVYPDGSWEMVETKAGEFTSKESRKKQ